MLDLILRFSEQFESFNRKFFAGKTIVYPLNRRAAIKDIVESLGVPHTEIGLISVDGKPVDFRFIPLERSRIAVHPIRPPFEVTRPSVLRPYPLKTIRFVADVNVGKLAALMRIAGLDTAYGNDFKMCTVCDRMYWRGSHHDHMKNRLGAAGIRI